MKARVVLSTIDDETKGSELARILIEEGLVRCVNIVSKNRSIYLWQGKIESTEEQLLILKTTEELLPLLEKRFHQLHPYDVPEFIVLTPEHVSHSYLEWLLAEQK